MRTKTVKTYIAFDNKEFKTKKECEQYELDICNHNAIRFFDSGCNQIEMKWNVKWVQNEFKNLIDENCGFFIIDDENDAVRTMMSLEQLFVLPEWKGEYKEGTLTKGKVYVYLQNGSLEIDKMIERLSETLQRDYQHFIKWATTTMPEYAGMTFEQYQKGDNSSSRYIEGYKNAKLKLSAKLS